MGSLIESNTKNSAGRAPVPPKRLPTKITASESRMDTEDSGAQPLITTAAQAMMNSFRKPTQVHGSEMEDAASSTMSTGENDTSDEEEGDGKQTSRRSRSGQGRGRWTHEEHNRFLEGLALHGRAWKMIAKYVVKTRSAEQVRIHAQKHFTKHDIKMPRVRAPTQDGHWTNEEHERFLELYEKYGKAWKRISDVLKTRTNEQIRTHAQKYFSKLGELRHRGYDGHYKMDGKRHLTKSFLLLHGPTSGDSKPAFKWPKPNSASTGRRPSSRRAGSSEDGDFFSDRQQSSSSSSASSAASSLTFSSAVRVNNNDGYVSRSGRQVTTRKWESDEVSGESGDEEPLQARDGRAKKHKPTRRELYARSHSDEEEEEEEEEEEYGMQGSADEDDAMEEEDEVDEEGEAALHLLRWQQYAQRPSSLMPAASDRSACVSSRASSSSLSSVTITSIPPVAPPRNPPGALSVLLQAASRDESPECPSTVSSSHDDSPPPSPTELQGAQALLSWQS